MLFRNSLYVVTICCLLGVPSFAAIHKKLAALPHGWAHVGYPADDNTSRLQICLQQQNLDKLQSLIYEVSTPGHLSYGHHMEKEEVDALLKPDAEVKKAVFSWLKLAGVSATYSHGHWVTFASSVGTANKLLNTKFAYYANDGFTKLRTAQYSVPDSLVKHIDLISPTNVFR